MKNKPLEFCYSSVHEVFRSIIFELPFSAAIVGISGKVNPLAYVT